MNARMEMPPKMKKVAELRDLTVEYQAEMARHHRALHDLAARRRAVKAELDALNIDWR